MPVQWGAFFAKLGVGLGLQFLAGQQHRQRPLETQRQPNEITSRGESDYPVVNVFGERRIPGREVWHGVSTWQTTDAPHFSEEHPGTGRTYHTVRALTKGEMDSLSALIVDEELWGPAGARVWRDRGETEDGGQKYRSQPSGPDNPQGTDKTWRIIVYPLANGEQGSTIRQAVADIGNVPNALPFDDTFRGEEVAYVHFEAFQPPFGASPLVVGSPLPIVWDEDSDGPDLEFVIKGRKLRIPTRGAAFDDWPVEFTRNAAAVRLWEILSFEGTSLRRVNQPSFIDAYEVSDRKLIVDVTDDLCNIRFAYRLTDENVAPDAPAGNAWPPAAPWQKNPPKTTTAMKYSWWCHQRKVNGVWGNWTRVRRYGRHVVRPDGDPRGETQEARITIGVIPSTGGFRRVTDELGAERLQAVTAYALDAATVNISPTRTEGDPYGGRGRPGPDDGDEEDPTNPDDEDPNPGGVEIPRGVNPGDPDSDYCGLFDSDKEVGQYEINGIVTSEDDIQTVRDEMDFAWAGSVVNDGGMLYARPGEDRDPVAHIDATLEDVEVLYAQSAPPLPERINACSFTLANSRTNGFKAYTMPRLVDREQAALDGKIISRHLGTRGFLTSPTAAKGLQRKELAAARPLNLYTYRVPLEYSRELWAARPGDRITVYDPQRGLNPVITRNQRNPLFDWGDARGRYMRILGRSLNFDDGLTMDFSVVAHPNGTFSRSPDFPTLEPDPSIPGNYVDAATGLALKEETYTDADDKVKSRIRVTWNLDASARTLVQWRPVVPGGIPGRAYRTLTVQTGDGEETLTETPPWGAPRQGSTQGAEFFIDDVRIGVTYEVRLINQSFTGIDSAPSDSATIFVTGNVGTLAALAGVRVNPLAGGWMAAWDRVLAGSGAKYIEIYEAAHDAAMPSAPLVRLPAESDSYSRLGLTTVSELDLWFRATGFQASEFSPAVKLSVTPLGPPKDGKPGARGLAGYASVITRQTRAANAAAADTDTEWFLSGATEDWNGNRVLTLGGINKDEENRLGRVGVGSLITVYGDVDDWGDFTLRSAIVFSGTGANRIATLSLAPLDSLGSPPTSGAVSIHFTPQGTVGINGSTWHFGMTVPPASLGADGDYYYRNADSTVWHKASGAWTKIGDLSGADGATWLAGTGVPARALGKDGDFYFQIGPGVVYRKVSGAWVKELDLPGKGWTFGSVHPDANAAAAVRNAPVGSFYFLGISGEADELTYHGTVFPDGAVFERGAADSVTFADGTKGDWRYVADLTGPQGVPGTRGISGYAVSGGFDERVENAVDADARTKWYMSGVGDERDWPAATVIALGKLSTAEQALLRRVAAGGLFTVYADHDNWGDYVVSLITVSSSGQGQITAVRDESAGKVPAIGQGMTFHVTPEGQTGPGLPPPENVTVTLNATSQWRVDWDEVPGATGYRLQLKYQLSPSGAIGAGPIDLSPDVAIPGTAKGRRSYGAIGNFSSGDQISFVEVTLHTLSGSNVVGEAGDTLRASGGPSLTMTASPSNTVVPAAPSSVSVAAGDRQNRVTWSAVSGVIRYQVRWRVGATGNWNEAPSQAGRSFTHTNTAANVRLVNGQRYDYQVRAGNAHEWSGWSSVISATPKVAASLPGVPRNVSAVTPGNGRGSFTFRAPSSWGNGSAASRHYEVQVKATTATVWRSVDQSLSATATSDTARNLVNGHSYQIRIRAATDAGESAWVTTAAFTPTAPAGRPTAPASARLSSSGLATWTPPSSWAGIPSAEREYRVEVHGIREGGGSLGMNTSATKFQYITDPNDPPVDLVRGETYQLRVAAQRDGGTQRGPFTFSRIVRITS